MSIVMTRMAESYVKNHGVHRNESWTIHPGHGSMSPDKECAMLDEHVIQTWIDGKGNMPPRPMGCWQLGQVNKNVGLRVKSYLTLSFSEGANVEISGVKFVDVHVVQYDESGNVVETKTIENLIPRLIIVAHWDEENKTARYLITAEDGTCWKVAATSP